MNQIEFNDQFEKALELMENSEQHLFITGKAGTGKSTLLQYFRKQTQKNVAILAPTGVAALNVKGQTVHSFFGFKPNLTRSKIRPARKEKRSLYTNLDTIIIDEISMVRADVLDCVDIALRMNRNEPDIPFGGVQMIFIGDLYQLPPVVTPNEKRLFEEEYPSPYFFSSFVFDRIDIASIELQKIYRQTEEKFIKLLNRIRSRELQKKDFDLLTSLHQTDIQMDPEEISIQLTTTNASAQRHNELMLQNLSSEEWIFEGSLEGEFGHRQLPSPNQLKVKVGAQVMMVSNDNERRWVNGTLGKITDIKKDDETGEEVIVVELDSGKTVKVSPYTWEMFKYYYDDNSGKIETEATGSYTQYPVILAWAVTIHKSQGKTFDHVVIDTGRGAFAHGQIYVALSRCTTLDGIILKRPILPSDIKLDPRVQHFHAYFVGNSE